MTVKERPILMSAPMVQAMLAARKTQTRRVIKPDWWRCVCPEDLETEAEWAGIIAQCPYGKVGDHLWVRETFYCNSYDYPEPTEHALENLYYRASPEDSHTHDCDQEKIEGWKPSIHMPRWASRLTLEVTGIRVERVQDITEENAIAEGSKPGYILASPSVLNPQTLTPGDYRGGFRRLWDRLNEKRGFGWKENPWVWALEFRQVEAGK